MALSDRDPRARERLEILVGSGRSLKRAQLLNAITILRAARHSQRREEILDRLDPDTQPVDVEGYR